MLFTMKPYVTYHYGNSNKFIQLSKGAMIDFKYYEQFDLMPRNADVFAECMDRTSKLYAYYGYLRQFPATMADATDGTVTLGDHANLIETWNRIGLNNVPNNANMTWESKSFTDVTPHEIQDMTTDRGKVTGGVHSNINNTGKSLFLKPQRSTIMAQHTLLFLTNAAK